MDVNTASDKEQVSVPGITAAIAKGIMDRRPFLTMAELDTFLGQSLSREQRTAAYDRLFLQVNLNTATDAEIMLIPRLGNRMLGEFKEYRPYQNIAQFRREIGNTSTKRSLRGSNGTSH